ncbi:MAG: helix-turn-helix domain-containing protein [Bacteroidota bacterium]
MFLSFPEFDIWSTPLLILSLQGLIFAALLLSRYLKTNNPSDLFLFLILIITCYHQTCYTVGFMGWYDTFRNTKINYALIYLSVAILPLIYFYVKSVTMSYFTFKKKDWLHFTPALAIILYRIVIYIYDAQQPGFNATQNGYLKLQLDEPIVLPIYAVFGFLQNLFYLTITFQLFYAYRKKIKVYFSNTYRLELNWILSFLILYGALFLYDLAQTLISEYIMPLSYMQRWWLNLFTGMVILYVGIKGYFTDTTKLKKLNFSFSPQLYSVSEISDSSQKSIPPEKITELEQLMETEKPYLDPDLNLADLAEIANMKRAQLSETINSGFGKNFNDFINQYRVNAFKTMLKANKQDKLSLLGIAFECGFNSKATFNRVFRKLTDQSPSEYLKILS